jgi:peptide/nickel transport system substrate-binding protein
VPHPDPTAFPARFRRREAVIAGALGTAGLLLGCGSDDEDRPSRKTDTRAPTGATVERLTWVADATPDSLDPTSANSRIQGYISVLALDGLLKMDAEGRLLPHLAESWKQTDPTTYVYKLRRGVRFSDGSPLTSEDVEYSWGRHLDPESIASFYFQDVKSVRATARDEVTVKLKAPANYFQYIPAIVVASAIVQKRFAQKAGKKIGTPEALTIGTGPYRLVEFKTDEVIRLERNEHFWGRTPPFNEVVFRVIPDEPTQRIAFQEGEVDGIFDVPAAGLDQWRAIDGLNIVSGPGTATDYITFDVTDGQLQDVNLRRALAHALDRPRIVEGSYRGEATPGVGVPFAPLVLSDVLDREGRERFYAEAPQLAFDLKAAKDALARSATPGGTTVTVYFEASEKERSEPALLDWQRNLREVGITLDLRALSDDGYEDQVAGKKKGVSVHSISADSPGTAIIVPAFMGEDIYNYAQYRTDENARLIRQEKAAQDAGERLELIRQLVSNYGEDVPSVPIAYPNVNVVTRDAYRYANLAGWFYNGPWYENLTAA